MAPSPRRLLAVTLCAVTSALAPSGLGAPKQRAVSHARRPAAPTRGPMEMKRKGKAGGGGPAGGMSKGQGPPSAMVEQQRQYAEYQKSRETSGLPSFDLYVKGPNSPTWYPAGSLGGDERSKDLIESYMTDWTKGFAKGGIDRGVASSLFPEKAKFVAQCLDTYPQLKKAKDGLVFGYKVSYEGLLAKRPEAAEVTQLSEDMQDNAFNKMKKNMGF